MKKSKMSVLTTLLAAALMITGCGSGQAKKDAASETKEVPVVETEAMENNEAEESSQIFESEEIVSAEENASISVGKLAPGTIDNGVIEGVSFVMIYNPKIYDEDAENPQMETALSTGNLAGHIYTAGDRAEILESDNSDLDTLPTDTVYGDVNIPGDRIESKADAMPVLHSKGEQYSFYYGSGNTRDEGIFTCIDEGEHCWIWALDDSINTYSAGMLADEFDNRIFPEDTAAFGHGRFTENGGKVNILLYPMPAGLCGFFSSLDIYAAQEVRDEDKKNYQFNFNQAIIHINSDRLDYSLESVESTIAHEYQHLICASDRFNYPGTPYMRVWLNEAMSAYAQDMLYPYSLEDADKNLWYYVSPRFRNGQSLYNFDIDNTDIFDIGSYGTVCLFERYLTDNCGTDVFSKVHDFWRNSYRTDIDEAQALFTSVSDEFRNSIDQTYSFPESVMSGFKGEEEVWISKMALDFFIRTLNGDLAHREDLTNKLRVAMLYMDSYPQLIEGGGRMLVAVEDDRYVIPEDADKGLIYVGFDQNFNIVTDLLTVE